MSAGIYAICNTVSGKKYIGQTNNFKARWSKHKYLGRNNGIGPLYDAMRKYGVEAFEFKVVEECHETDGRNSLEIKYITEMNTFVDGDGYNLRLGPAPTMHESTKLKLSIANKGKVLPPEVRAKVGRPFSDERKLSVSKRMKGVPKTQEHRDKISKALKGRTFSEETIAKITTKTRGRKFSDEARRNISLGHMGIRPSPETKAKRSASVKATMARKREIKEILMLWQAL